MITEKKLRKSEIKSKEDKIIDSIEFIEKSIPQDFEDFENSRLLKSAHGSNNQKLHHIYRALLLLPDQLISYAPDHPKLTRHHYLLLV